VATPVELAASAFIVPAVALVIAVSIYPVIDAVDLSLHATDLQARKLHRLDNYARS